MSVFTQKWSFLERLAANMAGPDKAYGGPYEFDFPSGGVWRYASDGKGIILVKEAHWKFTVPDAPPDGEVGKKILAYLSIPKGECRLVDLMALRAFLGEPIWTLPCPECEGKSKKSQYLHCSFCDCDGEVGPEPRFAWVCGMPLDANRLACLLEPFEADMQVQLIANPATGERMSPDDKILYVIGKDFRVLLMGMRPTVEKHDKWHAAPRFPREES